MHFSPASWLLAASIGPLANALGVVEVDLVFPRNASYSPTEDFPIVWAFQNSEKAQLLNPHISYRIINWANRSINFDITSPHPLWDRNLSSSDPYLFYWFHEALIPGQWWLTWSLDYQTRDLEALADHSSSDDGIFSHTFTWSRMFTIANSTSAPAKEVDLVAATSMNSCPEDGNAVAISLTDTTMEAPSGVNWAGREICAVGSNITSGTPVHTPNPCGVSISPEMAASISANWAALKCNSLNPPEDCPDNAAQQSIVLGVSGLLSVFGAVAFTVMHAW